MAEKPLLLITGVTGYIASWTALKAHETGKYRLRGTTRNQNSKRATKLKELCPGIDLVTGELLKDDGWKEAFEGVDCLLHMASPFSMDSKFDFVKPAVEGTNRVLGFAAAANVKKIVVTSSNAAVSWCQHPNWKLENKTYGENDWTIPFDNATDYESSKLLAEKAVWKFAEEHKEISVCVVNPGVTFGRSLLGTAGGSLDMMKMQSEAGMGIKMMIPYSAVQDIAEIHVNALGRLPELSGRRIVATESVWMMELFESCAETFNPMGYKFPSSQMPGCLVCCLFNCCCCINPLKEVSPMMNVEYSIDNKLAKSLTNSGSIRPYDKELVEMTHDFINSGAMQKKSGYVNNDN